MSYWSVLNNSQMRSRNPEISSLMTSPNRPFAAIGRWISIAAILTVLIAAHWWSPVESHEWHAIHLVLRKLFFLPVVLAAIWFGLRRALFVAAFISVYYVPHIAFQWQGQYNENINQLGELGTVWLTAALAGTLAQREMRALSDVAATHEGALIALVSALDAREHDTQLHSLRVREYSLRLADELGMDRISEQVLAEAALLHDVGKIGVPDEILLKPGPLSNDEWQKMKEHPEIGQRILKSIHRLEEAAEVVYAHHEHYDGSGYPRGLGGQDIPLGARVFAVVDAFDAIVSNRPYEKAMEFADARKRIQAASGSHFDPSVVEAFLNVPDVDWIDLARRIEALDGSQANSNRWRNYD